MIKDHCVSCRVRIVRDKLNREDYYKQYGNYCRTCSARPKEQRVEKERIEKQKGYKNISDYEYDRLERLVSKELKEWVEQQKQEALKNKIL